MPSIADFFRFDSIWFFVLQAAIWFGVCLVMIVTLAHTRQDRPSASSSLKANIGLFMMFVVLSCSLLYIFFGHTPVPTV